MTPIVSTAILRTQSDARLAALAREGHDRAFEAIVERYRKPLLRHCRRFLPEPRAEDAVQQTFLNAWSALRNGAEIDDLRAWLYRISRNAALDSAKRAGYDYSELSEALQLTPAPEDEVERRWVVRETLGGMAALPTGQREALLRTAVEGHSRAEIARDMRISEGAVRQLVHRARASLRAAATAVTPIPLATWASAIRGGGGQMGSRVSEMVAEAGAAGGAGMLLKAGTAVVAVGAIAVGTGAELQRSPKREASADPRPGQATVPAPDEARLARAVAGLDSSRRAAKRRVADDEPLTARSVEVDNSGPGSLNSGPGSINSGPGSIASGSDSSGPGPGGDDQEDNSGPGSTTSGSSSDSSGPGSGDDDGGDSSGPGSGDDGGDDGDNSGPGGGGDGGDGDDGDNSGSGSGDDGDGDNSGSGGGDNSGSGGGDNSGSGSGDDD